MKNNIFEKVFITFFEGMLSSLAVTLPVMQNFEKSAIMSIFITSIACGCSAVFNYILNCIRDNKDDLNNTKIF